MNNALVLLSFGISFVLGIIICPILIPVLKKMKFGQNVREEGPQSHLKKSGTPTMGGIMILAAFLIGSIPFVGYDPHMWFIICGTLLFGLIGLADDMLKIRRHQSEGLTAKQKMGLQVIVTAAIILYTALGTDNGTQVLVPFLGMVDFKGWFYPMAAIAILGTVNGANFTDGLDGLASSVTSVIAVFFTVCAVILGYGITPSTLSMLGALAAFLCFNCNPAKIFMGDTGSLALGGFVATVAFSMGMPIFLILAAFIYLAEIISVMLQVGYFKLTHGKRLFRMSPLHHHFELGGWTETRVVTVFSIITLCFCVISMAGLLTAVN